MSSEGGKSGAKPPGQQYAGEERSPGARHPCSGLSRLVTAPALVLLCPSVRLPAANAAFTVEGDTSVTKKYLCLPNSFRCLSLGFAEVTATDGLFRLCRSVSSVPGAA